MTRAHILKGSKEQIAEALTLMNGDVREAIIFVEDSSQPVPVESTEDIFAEMEPFIVKVGTVDDSRDAIYSPTDGE